MGSVATSSNLPDPYSGDIGDGYVVQDTGNLWVWDGSQWDNVGQFVGYTGSQGDTGFTGSRGAVGFTGSQGAQGNVGFTGSIGAQGVTGNVGFTGSAGAQGVTGNVGFTGSAGAQGVTGNVGFTGSIGATGATGNVGFTGSIGATGFTGSTGNVGIQGNTGFTGSQGLAGFNGSVGFTGSVGTTGAQGAIGFTGSVGTTGAQGPIGFTGSKGDTGFTGSASTVAGPTGFTGSQGAQGPQGNVGFTGSASTVAGPTGFTGSVGFTGSASTVAGPIGFTGSAGNVGIQGNTGFTGSQGDPAPDDAANVTYSNATSTLDATNVQAAIDELDTDKLDVSALTSSLIFYATSASSNVATYSTLVTSPLDADYDDPAVNITTGVITGTNQFVSALASEPGTILGSTGRINITTLGNIRKTAGSGTAKFYFEVYKRDSVGTESLLGTSSETPGIDSATYQEFFADALINPTDFTATDRVVVKFYGDRIAGGSDPTFDFQFGGESPVRTLFPVAVSAVAITPAASDVITDTSNFNGILSGSDTNVQLALDTIDDLTYVSNVTAGTGINVVSNGTEREVNIANTAVTAGTYGDAGNVAQVTVNAQGQITNVAEVALPGGGTTTVERFKVNYDAGGSITSISDVTSGLSLSITDAATGLIEITLVNSVYTIPMAALTYFGYDQSNDRYVVTSLQDTITTRFIDGNSGTIFGGGTVVMDLLADKAATRASAGFGQITHAYIQLVCTTV